MHRRLRARVVVVVVVRALCVRVRALLFFVQSLSVLQVLLEPKNVVVVVVGALRASYFGLWRHSYDLPSRAGVEVPRSAKSQQVCDFRTPVPKTRLPEVQGQITNLASSQGRWVF